MKAIWAGAIGIYEISIDHKELLLATLRILFAFISLIGLLAHKIQILITALYRNQKSHKINSPTTSRSNYKIMSSLFCCAAIFRTLSQP